MVGWWAQKQEGFESLELQKNLKAKSKDQVDWGNIDTLVTMALSELKN